MGEFRLTDVEMDLNLNLRPPSPPPAPAPHLGLGLGLASAPPFANNDFVTRPPDLISPRFEPRTSQSGFGDPEPTLSSNHRLSGRNSRYRWRRLSATPVVAESSPVAFVHQEQRPKNEEIPTAEEANQSSANFDCNICLTMASEPVVTSCGHLFCWPCLYQWLHVHSTSKECPVCKGEVTDANITPIYGRGANPAGQEADDGGPMALLPPRPHGHRVEGLRHRRRISSRPFSRRVEEIIRLRSGHGPAEPAEARGGERIEDLIGEVSDQIMHRLRFAGRLQGEDLRERIIGRRSRVRSAGPHVIISQAEPRVSSNLDAGETIRDFHFSRRLRADRLAAIRTRLESMEGMLQTLTNVNPNPTVSVTLHPAAGSLAIPEAGQPSFEDNNGPAAPRALRTEVRGGEAVLDQGSVRSIHPHRRIDVQASGGGSGSSLDVDGGLIRATKIRRIN